MNAKEFGRVINPLAEAESKARELNEEMKALLKHGHDDEGACANAQAVAVSSLSILKEVRKALDAAREIGSAKVARDCGDVKE